MCISLEKNEDLVLVLEKETKFNIGKLGSGFFRFGFLHLDTG